MYKMYYIYSTKNIKNKFNSFLYNKSIIASKDVLIFM